MYRNYDGNKSTFAIPVCRPRAQSGQPFGVCRDSHNDGAMTLMVINKDLTNATPLRRPSPISPTVGPRRRAAHASNVITRLADVPYANGFSATRCRPEHHLVCSATAKSLRLRIAPTPRPADGIMDDGQGGQRYLLQSSTNLTVWSAVSTNTFASNSFRSLVGTTNPARIFIAFPEPAVTEIISAKPLPVLLTSRLECSIVWPCGAFEPGQESAPTKLARAGNVGVHASACQDGTT